MRAGYKLFSFYGAPINVHVSILVVFYFFHIKGDVYTGTISSLAYIFLIIMHELGHAFFVRKYRHELVEIRIYPILGQCLYNHDARCQSESLIHAGGLISQLLLLGLWFAVLGLLEIFNLQFFKYKLVPLTYVFVHVNIWVLIFNSLPVPGLDGFELWKRFTFFILDKCKRNKLTSIVNKHEHSGTYENVVDIRASTR